MKATFIDRKRCSRCKKIKSSDSFCKSKASVTGLQAYCRPCTATRARQYYAENKTVLNRTLAARSHRKTKYGLTDSSFQKLYSQQGGMCAICRLPESAQKRSSLSVDHDHTTGKVRGLLCSACNFGLGKFKDQPNLLEAAASYLRRTI